ncbi:MAG: MFS transporter [Rothia sp. (in: high G+C Gram-positive bacteria)]|nr:MFS transporter [Rothia sp. (in: high G+C Gram-positive bacteria)]
MSDFEGYRAGSRAYRRLLAALCAAGLATFAQLYSPQPLIPHLSRDLKISADQAALSMSSATTGLALCTLLWAALADRLGRVRTMTLALCGATLLGLLTPWVASYPLMLALRTLEGAFLGGVAGLALAVIVSEAHPSVRLTAAGFYISGTSLGGLAGRIIAGPLSELVPWRLAMFAVSLLGLLAALLFVLLMPPSHDRPDRRGNTQEDSKDPAQLSKILALFKNPPLLALFITGFTLMGSLVSIFNYIGFKLQGPPYFLSQTLLSLIFLTYLSGTFSSQLGASLAQRLGQKLTLLASCLLMAAGCLLTLAGPLPWVLAGLLLLTSGFFAAHALASSWSGALVLEARSQATALYNSFYYAGSALVGWATGLLLAQQGWAGVALTCTGLLLLSSLLAALLLPAPRPQQEG